MTDTERPFISTYETDESGVEHLVYRQANDEEWADIQARQEAAANAPAPENPVLAAVRRLSPDEKKELLAIIQEQ